MIGIVCYNKHPLDTQQHELYRNKSYDKALRQTELKFCRCNFCLMA